MELQEYLRVISKRWTMIFIFTLAAVLTSAVFSYIIIKPTYKSTISVIIGKAGSGTDESQVMNYSELEVYKMLTKTYCELGKSRTVAENVIKSLKLNINPEELQKMISITPKDDTEFLIIEVKSKDSEQAMLIANQLAESLKEVSIAVKNMDNVQILDSAQRPTAPDSPKPILNMAIAFLLGFMVSIGLAFLLEYLDNTVKTQEDIERLIGVPVIGVIPFAEELK